MKLMYAVWCDRPDALLGVELRRSLARTGAQRLVVNVDDAEVAHAQLRLTTFDRPVAAVLSVWTPGPAGPVSAALEEVATEMAGWVVEPREPVPPPGAPDGHRTDALVNVALLRIPAGMERGEWLRVWRDEHTQVAIETQATFGYVQNTVIEPLAPGQPVVDALVEEFFPMAAATDPHAFYGSGGDQVELERRMNRMFESVSAFGAAENIDVVPSSRYTYAL